MMTVGELDIGLTENVVDEDFFLGAYRLSRQRYGCFVTTCSSAAR